MKKDLLVIHGLDTYAHMDVGVKEVREWHISQGWVDIGYAHIIRRNAVLEAGRDLDGDGDVSDEIGAHAKGFNERSIGIALAGGRGLNDQPQFNYTVQQLRVLNFICSEYESRYPGIEIIGHCQISDDKACPCFDVSDPWWRNL